MILVFGSRMYGRVDDVPGMFHVATRFGHLWYLPLIPLGSMLVFEHRGKPVAVLPIKFSFKSFGMAWLRVIMCVLVAIAASLALAIALDRNPRSQSDWWIPATIAVVFAVAWWYTCFGKFFRRASYGRALRLAEHAKLSDTGKIMLEVHFGNISADEAEALIESAREAAAESGKDALAAR